MFSKLFLRKFVHEFRESMYFGKVTDCWKDGVYILKIQTNSGSEEIHKSGRNHKAFFNNCGLVGDESGNGESGEGDQC
jgi:hypothetical protein